MAEIYFDGFKLDEVNPKADLVQGVKPGKAHLLVTDVSEKDGKYMVVTEVVAHDLASEVGRTLRIWLDPESEKDFLTRKVKRFVHACKLVTPEQILEAANSGEPISIEYEHAIDKTFCAIIEQGRGEYAHLTDVKHKMYRDDSPDTQDFPKNPEFIGEGSPFSSAIQPKNASF